MVDPSASSPRSRPQLWLAPLSGRTYALPPDVTPPPGEVLICAVDGALARVDEAAIAEYAVAEQVMRDAYRAAVEQGAMVAGRAAGAAWGRLTDALPGLVEALDHIGAGEPVDGAALLGLLTGRSVEAVRADPSGARQAVEAAVAELAAAPAVGAVSAAEVEPTEAELDALADHIGRWMGAGAEAPAGVLRDRAKTLFEALPPPARGRPDPLQRMLGAINALYVTAAADPLTAAGRARQQAEFRADARARIDAATRDWKPPTPTFAELLSRGSK